MLYLILDPKIFFLSDLEITLGSNVENFIAVLGALNRAIEDYDIELGLTTECIVALKRVSNSAFDTDTLERMVGQLKNYNVDMILIALNHLVNHLLSNAHLDNTLANLTSDDFYYDITQNNVVPIEHIQRLETASLQQAFQRMMGAVTFARKQEIVPMTDIEHLMFLTTYTSAEEQHWATVLDHILINVHFEWIVDDTVQNAAKLNKISHYDDQFKIVTWSENLTESASEKKSFNSALEAAHAACKRYSKRLILTKEAEETTRSARERDYKKLYRLLCGLVEVWFPAYEKWGDWKAHEIYYESYSYQISGEAEQVKENLQMRKQREGTYKDNVIFANWHVKLGTGPLATRIYFAPLHEEDGTKIILTRIGAHPSSARYR